MFILKLETDGKTFAGEDLYPEVARLLRHVADVIASTTASDTYHTVVDAAGDSCGSWKLTAKDNEFEGPRCFRVIRFREDASSRTVKNHLTLTEARAHCANPKTRGTYRNGVKWFDGYDYMPGCRPKEGK